MDPASVCAFTHKLLAASSVPPSPSLLSVCPIWISDMADAVDEYEAAHAPPQSKAPMPAVYHDEVPTEPATSPRSQVVEVPVHPTYIEELRLPSREYGPHPEPERFVTRWVSRDGYTQEEWEAYFRKHRQAWSNHDMENERQQAEAAEHEAHQRSIQEWEARVKAQELDNPAIPCGPTPAGTSSMRALPDVHEALRQNDPRMASYSSQPSRRLRLLLVEQGQQLSILMQSLHGLVRQFNLRHLQHSDQLKLKASIFHWQLHR